MHLKSMSITYISALMLKISKVKYRPQYYLSGMKDIIVFVGPAGSGKSTLTASFGNWLEKETVFTVNYVNLDPGCEYTPYTPNFDVRCMVSTREIMKREKLGPNGAYLRSMDEIYRKRHEIVSSVNKLSGNFILVDTPGQMEIFIFKETGPALIELFKEIGRVVAVVVFDPTLASDASGYIVLNLLGIVVQLRLKVESLFVINKSDLLERKDSIELDALEELIKREPLGLMSDLALSCVDLVRKLSRASRIVFVSALRQFGLDQLYDLLHEVWCTCGDLT
ncbi:MAG TPA: hypothetical protein ENF55_05665 [Thermoprotei archaeon]|nr:MAG: hypothetical protein DRJ63_08345 [Thermoprotei archaeon]HDI75426.1 hypothetical protein [Thermoprotei archaeon]